MPTPSLQALRAKHPRFIYDSYQAKVVLSGFKSGGSKSSELKSSGLKIEHFFKIEPDLEFKAEVAIEGVTEKMWLSLPKKLRDEWVFNLGLAELPSYWKLTASPKIAIEAGHLSQEQIAWWHKLLIKGMGEYFYVNQIDFTAENFVTWEVNFKEKNKQKNDLKATLIPSDQQPSNQQPCGLQPTAKYLLPLGGGKDSAAAACFLKQHNIPFSTFLLNPTPAMKQVSAILKPATTITARRTIDPRLLALNKQGYLNGHVPFSAYLGFLSRLTGLIFGYQSVVISNERSSNQGNVQYLGHEINHQYSKSYEFERDFNDYLAKPAYFSLMRPLYELQISRLFANCPQFDQLSTVFRSCNRGQKTNTWCGQCPKCLFTFVSLFPFVSEERIKEIFGRNLLENDSLLPLAKALLGQSTNKPFECVGTHQETKVAFYLCQEKYKKQRRALPVLLEKLNLSPQDPNQEIAKILQAWNQGHQIPTRLVSKLKKRVESLEYK